MSNVNTNKIGKIGYTGLALSGVLGGFLLALGLTEFNRGNPFYKNSIKSAFPNTKFERIYTDKTTGLRVAEAGGTVLYFTKDAKYALVGNVLDLENKVDLTDKRQQELKVANTLEARAFGKELPSANREVKSPDQPRPADRNSRPTSVILNVPEENMVVHNKGASTVMYVVSDYNCGFCKQLHAEMAGMDVEIREIPIGILGQESTIKAAAVLCSEKPATLAKEFFKGNPKTQITTCTDGENKVRQNNAWAAEQGVRGTPFLIMENGKRVNSGYLPNERLKKFLGIS